LETTIRNRICGSCEDGIPEAVCGRTNPDTCSLYSLIPEVARAVLVTDSHDILDYVRAIREHVCNLCGQLQINGNCDPRELPHCALDAHMMSVVGAIEEVTGRSFDRSRLAG
jgi:hypothetical protein